MPPLTLDLETAIITGGTVTNHGLIDANTGTTNSISNAVLITNTGTLEATGTGVELQILSATTFNNSGTLEAIIGATLDLDSLTVTNTAAGIVLIDATRLHARSGDRHHHRRHRDQSRAPRRQYRHHQFHQQCRPDHQYRHAGGDRDGVELQILSATTFNNSGTLQAVLGATLDLDSLTVTNTAAGIVLVDATAGSTLDLETAIITGGTITNHGLIDANTGTTNSISNAVLITNTGTLEATGTGVELQILSATTFNNSGTLQAVLGATLDLDSLTVTNTAAGIVLVDATAGSTLDLETAIITGGTITNHGLIDANTGTTNSISNAVLITNTGTLEATGTGVELQILSATTFNNSGTLQAVLGATLDLDSLTVTNTAAGIVLVDATAAPRSIWRPPSSPAAPSPITG